MQAEQDGSHGRQLVPFKVKNGLQITHSEELKGEQNKQFGIFVVQLIGPITSYKGLTPVV